MRTALKEWAVVIEALVAGAQPCLLRKGGIAEGKRGFELKHDRFLFFPTWEHQQREMIRPEHAAWFDRLRPADPEALEIAHGARVADIVRAPATIDDLRRVADRFVWNDRYLQVRYDYRPDLPLYLVFVEPFTLSEPVRIPHDRRYRGCRSWVDLYEDVPVDDARPALPAGETARRRRELLDALAPRKP